MILINNTRKEKKNCSQNVYLKLVSCERPVYIAKTSQDYAFSFNFFLYVESCEKYVFINNSLIRIC